MKVQHIIGADLSKNSIDFFCHGYKSHLKIQNNSSGFKLMLEWLNHLGIHASQMILVMEYTGLYSYHLEKFAHQHYIAFTKVSALAIKRSLGLVRGKSDKVDAQRIARYGFEKRDTLFPTPKTDPVLERLAMLHSVRDRLVKNRASMICAVKEYLVVLKPNDLVVQSQRKLIKELTVQIEKLDAQIRQLIKDKPCIKENCQLLQSIKGVGPVLSVATIVKTKNFTCFRNARKFSCFCGAAPFEHTSGKSIRGKTRVSQMADKEMKTLLTLSARSAVQHDQELKSYYIRRTQEGKSKKSTINIIRNKILYRMFAVIKRQTPFVDNYLKTA